MTSLTQSMDMNLSKLQEMVKYREAWCAAVHRVAKNRTRLSDQNIHLKCSPFPGPTMGFRWLSGKEAAYQCRRRGRHRFTP